jgi:hypothetical protein
MTALDIGLGAHRVLSHPGTGRVLSVHGRAVYLRLPDGLCALVTPAAPRGPLHLRCDPLPPCRPGDPVTTDGRVLRGPDWAMSVHPPRWAGRLPAPGALAGSIRPDAVADWARRMGGRGPGLTPAGDDVLAGMLLVCRAAHPDAPEVEAGLRHIAAGVATTGVASAFLDWAARGQCIAPAHDALAELAVHGPAETTPACEALARIGASSGEALLLGLRAGLSGDPASITARISTIVNVQIP